MPSTPMLTVLDEDRHWWFATRTRAILAYLDRYVGPGQGRRVLDVGCGAANMTHHLRHYGDVIGVDSNPKPLEIASERGLEAYQGSADDLPFEDGAFDLVTLLDTVEHVPAEDTVFEECRRVLRGPDACKRACRGQIAGHGARVHVPVEPERRHQHAPAPLHRPGADGEAGASRLPAVAESLTTTSSCSRWLRASSCSDAAEPSQSWPRPTLTKMPTRWRWNRPRRSSTPS